MNLENLYQLRSLLNVIIQEEEDKLRDKPFQSEVAKTFHQRLHEKMEKKQVRPNEHFLSKEL